MNTLKSFAQFLNESNGNKVDLEGVLHSALGDDYLDNREDILTNIDHIITSNPVEEAMYQLLHQYPELMQYESELLDYIGTKGSLNMEQSPYEGDTAIENLLMKLMPIRFIEEKDEILDMVYSLLSSGWVAACVDQIIDEYPELAGHEQDLIHAANTEGYND